MFQTLAPNKILQQRKRKVKIIQQIIKEV